MIICDRLITTLCMRLIMLLCNRFITSLCKRFTAIGAKDMVRSNFLTAIGAPSLRRFSH
jgi:hypothetical protein